MIDNEDQNNDAVDSSDESETSPDAQNTTDDTLESASLQEEDDTSQNDSQLEASSSIDDSKDDDIVHDNEEKSESALPEDFEKVIEGIDKYGHSVNEMLVWKEELKLHTLESIVNLPYYEMWTMEANEWFRRSVVLKARRKKLMKRKGA